MKNKKNILIILLVLISLLVISSLSVGILKMTGKSLNLIPNQLSSFDITVTPNTSGYGSVSLDWSNYNYADKNFKVYKSSDGTNYETIGIDYTTVKSVKVLNVYPQEEARQYAGWMQNWGKGIIQADQVAIENFNSNPAEYLYRTDNGWNYDVVVFGF